MSALRTAWSTAGWGVYCASSWTWCIGMFLPVILLGRYGWWGFLIFAIPNVLGCAAFGYVLKTQHRSQKLVARHNGAMLLFSLITIAYHVFFLGFVCWLLLPGSAAHETGEAALWIALAVPIIVVLLGQVLASVPTRAWPTLAAIAYLFSLYVFASLGLEPLKQIQWQGNHPPIDVAWLVPVMLFGFLLCPYLDLTFHRARQQSPSRHAFAVFGVAFTVMILLTCAYADILTNGLAWIVLAHLLTQSMFTVGAHMRECITQIGQTGHQETPASSKPAHAQSTFSPVLLRLVLLLPVAALPVVFLGATSADPLQVCLDNYLRFLAFYGLLFPAYAVLFMGRGAFSLTQRNLGIFVVVCLAFLPMYEAGFLHSKSWLLVAPPLVLVLARLKRMLARPRLPQMQNRATETIH